METNQFSILAVDDQGENLLALEAIFTDPSIRLVKARSGREALKHLLDEEFAVILMDVNMPLMDGFETATAIRSRKKTRHTPIIFLTATHKDSFNTAAGYDIGAVDYIFKPIVPEILQAKVAFFVELFKKTRESLQRAEELAAYKFELEESLAQQRVLNEELQELSKAAAAARDQALATSRFKSEFLANMSHEIRTPMNGVLGMVEILLKSGLNSKQNEYATTLKEAGRSLLAVINDILDFSKIEAGKLTLYLAEFEPIRLLESIAELLSEQASQQGLSLLTFIDPQIPQILIGDYGRLRQIIMNLAGNAIKFSDHGEVLIRAFVESENNTSLKVRFSVTDSGIGLTEEEILQLFQPFVQPDIIRSRKSIGTGLGLSISKQLVELMGGQIGVTSVKGQGATFWFCAPLEKAALQTDKYSLTEAANIHVLIVDDQPGARETLGNYLTSWGMRNTSASNTAAALDLLTESAKSDPYQLALIDLYMPGQDGMQLAKAVREHVLLRDMKLVLVTALDKPGIGEEAISLGFDAYLTKPVRQSPLLNAITTLFFSSRVEGQHGEQHAVESVFQVACTNRSELILVAEDHKINQQVAILLLKELGFEAHIAENGEQAIALLGRVPYALVLMDCQMPIMDGFQATKNIRKMEIMTGKHVPIIATTAHAIEGSVEDCLSAGMDDYTSKPIDPGALAAILEKWLPVQSADEDGGDAGQVKSDAAC